MNAIEQYFHVVLFIMEKVNITFMFMDETLVCKHWNESYWAVLSFGTVEICRRKFSVWPFKQKLLNSTFTMYMHCL